MDKNEYNLKLEEMDKYVSQGNYGEAAKVADSIDWRRVRNVRTLCMVSEIYEADNRYEDSKELLLRAYRRSPVGRSVLYRLVEVTIQLKQFDEAIEYYSEYVQAAPHDNNKYILKYKIYRGRGSSLDEQIEILKEYLSQEYNEKWAYELAKLYQQAGRIQECLASCDDLVLWFHSGKYVTKALELKQKYAALTPKQQEIYDRRFEEEAEETDDVFSDETRLGQEKELVETHEEALADTIMADTEKEIAQAVVQSRQEDMKEVVAPYGESEEETAAYAEEREPEEENPERENPVEEPDEEGYGIDDEEDTEYGEPEEPKDLQSELVKSMREIVGGVVRREEPDEEELAADQLIEQAAQEQETARAAAPRIPEAPKMELPKPPRNQQAPQLSIDDILLSMGEKGAAVRKAAAQSEAAKQARAAAPAGAVSAMDEALLNMGMPPEEIAREEAPAPEEPVKEAAKKQETEKEEVKARVPEQEPVEEQEQPQAQETPEIEHDRQEDVILAKTRRIPTEEIARRHAVYDVPRTQDTEEAPPEPQAFGQQKAEEAEAPVQRQKAAGQASEQKAAQGQPANSGRPKRQPNPQPQAPSHGVRMRVRDYHRDLFAGFLGIQNLEDQIASAIAMAEQKGEDRTSRTGNILIFGDHGCGKSTIAVGIAKAIAMDKNSQFAKMARIYATDLNRKDIAATIAKIAGGTLIIEEAGDLEDGIVDQLTTAMEFRTDGLIIILEDEQKYIHELLMRHPRFTMKFTSQIFIPTFTIDELVGFGEIYAGNQDYVLSQTAAEALHDRIGSVAAQGDAVSITNVIELVDRAIHKSNKFFRKMTFGKKRYDENDCVILQEKDFK